MTIEFQCTECNQTLRTKDEKAGSTAKCPNCGTPLTVPQPAITHTEPEDPWEGVQSDQFQDDSSYGQPAEPDFITCSVCGEQNPSHSTNCRACGEKLNVPTSQSPIRHREVHVGFVVSEAWEIYKENLGMAIAAVIIPGVINGILNQVVQTVGTLLMEADEVVGVVVLIGGVFMSYVIQAFLALGSANMLLKIARGKPVEIGDLFNVSRYFLRAILIFIVIGLAAGLVFGILVGVGVGAGIAAGEDAAPMIIIPTVAVGVILAIALGIATWPVLYVLIDRDEPGIGALTTSLKLFKYHWTASLVCILLGALVNIGGLLACCVGLIFTAPYAQMLFTVVYCQLMGYKTAGR